MHCPFCGHSETKVIDSRLAGEGRQIRRRRECLECAERFTTFEAAELLLGVIEHGSPQDRQSAMRALGATKATKFLELAKISLAGSSREVQAQLRDILRTRGITM